MVILVFYNYCNTWHVNILFWFFHGCRWGPVLETGTYKNKQRLYLSEQVNIKWPMHDNQIIYLFIIFFKYQMDDA